MSEDKTLRCILCGEPLEPGREAICRPCAERFKQERAQAFAEAKLVYRLRNIRSETCLICGSQLHGKPFPLCLDCEGLIGDAEVMRE